MIRRGGGDIDLLLFSQRVHHKEQRKIKIRLYEEIGEQKIDLLLAQETAPHFIDVIMEHAVQL